MLSRRKIFALPLAIPAVAASPAPPANIAQLSIEIDAAPLKEAFKRFSVGFVEWEPAYIQVGRLSTLKAWCDFAFTDDDGHDWTQADVAATLGIAYAPSPIIIEEMA